MAEIYAKVDSNTLGITATKTIPKTDLLAQKKVLELRIADLELQLKAVDNKLKILEGI